MSSAWSPAVLSALLVAGAVLAAQPRALDGTAWTLASLPGHATLAGEPTLRFEDGRLTGRDGCNNFGGPYSAEGESFRVAGTLVSTQMACPEPVMAQATAVREALTRARSLRYRDGSLVILDDAGTELAVFAPQSQTLEGTAWEVTGYNNGRQAVVSVLAGTSLTLDFSADGRVSGSAGCNRFTGAYTTSGREVAISGVAATRRMCMEPARVMEQEDAFLKALPTGVRIRIDGGRLEIRTAEGALVVSARRR